MSNPIASPGGMHSAERSLRQEVARFWWQSVRNVLLGILISVLPAFAFYSVAFSYSPRQVHILASVIPWTLLVVMGADVLLNRLYLRPVLRWGRTAEGDLSAIYTRLHNFQLFSFVRVFGPHALIASTAAQLAVLYANVRMGLGVPSSDYALYWLLNLTLVPIGHAVFEYHANGWASRGVLARLASQIPAAEHIPGIWRVGLAIRLTIFYTMLAVSPLVLLATAFRLWPLPAGVYAAALTQIGGVIAGVTGLNLLLLFLFALDVRRQTRFLLDGLERAESEDLEARVDIFSPDEFGVISEGVNRMIGGLRERRKIRELFGIYLSPEVSRAILEGTVSLQGETRKVSILFCDIRDFTRYCSTRTPREVVDRLNQFFARMSKAINAHGGTINKFLGDGFLAVFGAPVDQPDHARRAVESALDMERELAAFNVELAADAGPPMEIGIGIDSGEVIAGNVGAIDRKEYTVIGDPVNRSSRIEQLNKSQGTRILISARTHELAGIGMGRALAPIAVKGIEEPVRVVAVGTKG